MSLLTRSGSAWRKSATALTATAVTATALAFVGSAPAQASVSTPVLTWNISQQFVDHLSTRTVTDGAAFADGAFTFPLVEAEVSGTETTYSYNGSVKGAFVNGDTELYSVTISDPEIAVENDGSGSITAEVSAANAAFGQMVAAATTPARVTVAEFAGATTVEKVLTATPNWAGVLVGGSPEGTALGLADPAKPVDGKAFHPAMLGQLTSGVRSHFYASGSPSDPKKAPGVLGADAQPLAKITSASAVLSGGYVEVNVSGSYFDTSWRPGASGIYVGLANEQDITKVSSTGQNSGMEKFVASTFIPNIALVDGNFTDVEFSGAKSKLVRGAKYRVYTWTAHGNPTAGDVLIKSFPVNIANIAKNSSKTAVKVSKKPTSKKAGKATVTVTGNPLVKVSGKVTFKLKKGKATKKVKAATLKNGKVVVTLPKLKKGKWKLTAKYVGDGNYSTSIKTVTIKVKK